MPARSAQLMGPELRPESEWEYISFPGGVYVARRVAVVELTVGEEPAVIVLFTHDRGFAARVAWSLWCAEQGGGLTRPVRHWWRRVPADPATVERDGYEHRWWPSRPGTPGVIPLVEFPLPPEQHCYHSDLAQAFLLHGDRERALDGLTIARWIVRSRPIPTRGYARPCTPSPRLTSDRRRAWIGVRS